jgi:GNAT superfamily N-acetyltransferase
VPATIRRADTTDADLETIAGIVCETIPEWPTSVDDMHREDALYPGIVRFLAHDHDRAVGAAIVGRVYMHPPDYDAYWATIAVLPAKRRLGIGSRLLAATAAVARGAGKRALHLSVTESRPDAVAFLVHRGFVEHARHKMVRLELGGLEPPAVDLPPGLAVTTLAERPDLVEGVHAVAVEAFADIPGGDEPPAAGDLAEFRARDIDWPTVPKDAFMIALDGSTDTVVGYSNLVFPPGRADFAYHDMTAVARAWRGRGVATALKRATIAWAVRAGLDHLDTGNDPDNAPMRAVNRQLGFAPRPDELTMRGLLDDIEPRLARTAADGA